MSLLTALFDKQTHSFEQAFGVKDITSDEMLRAIRIWYALYFEGDAPAEEDDCQRLPVAIISKLCKTVFSEYKASIQGNDPKAAYMSALLEQAAKVRKVAMQHALVGGEALIKPVLTDEGFAFTVVRRDCMIPLARDVTGRITSVGTSEVTATGGRYYTLLERRTVDASGTLTIESKLYVSDSRTVLGAPVALNSLDKYANLSPVLALQGMHSLGMAQLKTPLLNCVDGSQDGVSVYAPAVGLIKNINRNEQQLDDEFENGASRVIASDEMLKQDSYGRKHFHDKLFVGFDEQPEDIGVTIFSPALREASYLSRKQEYLRNIESTVGLKRGILSEVEAAERTATEITSSAGDYNLTIIDFQAMWADALSELLVICDRLGQVYHLCGSSKFDPAQNLVIDWGDGVLFDRERTWSEYQSMVAAEMLKPELALAWYFNLPCDTPADIQDIRARYMPELDSLVEDETDADA